MTTDLYYKHSGKFEAGPLAISLPAALAAAVVLAAIYAYLVLYLPIAGYVTFLIAAGFGMGVGLASGFAMRWAKLRSVGLANAFVALVAAAAVYMSWVVWTFAFVKRSGVEDASLVALLVNPAALWRIVALINAEGAWSIKAFTPTGFVLTLLWLAEAGIIFVCATLAGVTMVSDHAFCERCETWCETSEGVVRLGAQTPTYVKKRLEAKDLAFLEKLGLARSDAKESYRLDLEECPACHMTQTLTVQHVTVTVDSHGKSKESQTALVNKLLITSEEIAVVRDLPRRAAAATAARSAASPSTAPTTANPSKA